MCRRGTRNRGTAARAVNREELKLGYSNFPAQETDDRFSGTKDTSVTMVVSTYGSSSGTSHHTGHAEMDALNALLTSHPNMMDDWPAFLALTKTIKCDTKPCCYRCSVVLGLLNFAPAGSTTRKTSSGMGQTQWVLPEPLNTHLKGHFGNIAELLEHYSNVSYL